RTLCPRLREHLMPASSDSCRDRSVRPSVSQQATLSWADLLNLTVVLAGAAVILWGDGMLMLPQQVFLWSLLVFFQVLRYGWALFRPFGAVMRYDLIRSARKGRYVSLRCLYATALLLMFFLVYWQWFVGPAGEMRRLWGAKVRANDWSRIVQLTDSVLHRVVTVVVVAVLLLYAALTAGCIAGGADGAGMPPLWTS